jgi:hypothetical protein
MDWIRFRGALIRFFWTVVFPAIGGMVVYFNDPKVMEEFGVTNSAIVLGIGATLYFLKKLFWPNTVL